MHNELTLGSIFIAVIKVVIINTSAALLTVDNVTNILVIAVADNIINNMVITIQLIELIVIIKCRFANKDK